MDVRLGLAAGRQGQRRAVAARGLGQAGERLRPDADLIAPRDPDARRRARAGAPRAGGARRRACRSASAARGSWRRGRATRTRRRPPRDRPAGPRRASDRSTGRCRAARWASIGRPATGWSTLALRRAEPGSRPGGRQHEHPRQPAPSCRPRSRVARGRRRRRHCGRRQAAARPQQRRPAGCRRRRGRRTAPTGRTPPARRRRPRRRTARTPPGWCRARRP